MEKTNCIICGTEFNYRKGKLYCSDSCKTKAYEKRKSGVKITGLENRPKGSNIVFDIGEFEKVCSLLSEFTIPFDTYCFFRKNLPNNLPVQKIASVLSGYWGSNKINDAGNVSEASGLLAAFTEFQKNFFAGTFEIRDDSNGSN